MLLLASDYDGTLRRDSQIAPADIDAIRHFQAKGHLFGLVTGRSLSMLQAELAECKDISLDFIIAHNGGCVFDKKLAVIHQSVIPFPVVEALIAYLKNYGTAMFGVAAQNAHHTLCEQGVDNTPKDFNKLIVYREYTAEEVLGPKQILSFYVRHTTFATTEALLVQLEARFAGQLAFHYNNGCIDVTAPGVDKSSGIAAMQRHCGARAAFAIGDERNDIGMLRDYEGFAISTGNPLAIAAASHVVPDVAAAVNLLLAREDTP